ncbi:hypothetical protein GCM10023093_02070 [Nemorincola caseinilytica]|uniref:Bacterial toxin 23 domain-containing protein n=1 Tax=Nemorincola caseinilytica TaxID=2054315 RepID=A0ABP8N287_9BACT
MAGTGWGANAGLVAAIGNRFQRLGITVQGYYQNGIFQANAEVRAYHNFRNLGPAMWYSELVTSAGLVVGYGGRTGAQDPFPGISCDRTGRRNSIGYAQNLYLNRIGTSQWTGTVSFRFRDISIISENDIFACSTLDRFRTGAFLLQYRYMNKYLLALNCTMWTGQMGTNKVAGDKDFPHPCYMDTAGGAYTSYSHGLLSAQFRTPLDAGQNIQANAGIDAEQVRNLVQNRLIHDMIFLPRRLRPQKNCHIPMLDTAGHQYLHRPGQQVRPVRPYWNVFSAPATFY